MIYSGVKIDGLSFFVASSSNSRGQHTVAPSASPKTLENYRIYGPRSRHFVIFLFACGGFMSGPQMARCQSMHTVGFNSANLTTDAEMLYCMKQKRRKGKGKEEREGTNPGKKKERERTRNAKGKDKERKGKGKVKERQEKERRGEERRGVQKERKEKGSKPK